MFSLTPEDSERLGQFIKQHIDKKIFVSNYKNKVNLLNEQQEYAFQEFVIERANENNIEKELENYLAFFLGVMVNQLVLYIHTCAEDEDEVWEEFPPLKRMRVRLDQTETSRIEALEKNKQLTERLDILTQKHELTFVEQAENLAKEQAQVAEQEQVIVSLKAAHHESTLANKRVEEQNKNLLNTIDDMSAEHEKILAKTQEENKKKRDEMAAREQKIDELHTVIVGLRQTQQQEMLAKQQIEHQLNVLSKKYSDMTEVLEKKTSEHQAIIQVFEQQIKHLQSNHDQLQRVTQQEESSLATQKKELEESLSTIQILQKQQQVHVTTRTTNMQLLESVDKKQAEINKLKSRLTELEHASSSSSKDATDKISQLDALIAGHEQHILELKGDIEQRTKAYTSLVNEKNHISETNTQLEQMLSARTQEMDRLSARITELEQTQASSLVSQASTSKKQRASKAQTASSNPKKGRTSAAKVVDSFTPPLPPPPPPPPRYSATLLASGTAPGFYPNATPLQVPVVGNVESTSWPRAPVLVSSSSRTPLQTGVVTTGVVTSSSLATVPVPSLSSGTSYTAASPQLESAQAGLLTTAVPSTTLLPNLEPEVAHRSDRNAFFYHQGFNQSQVPVAPAQSVNLQNTGSNLLANDLTAILDGSMFDLPPGDDDYLSWDRPL